MKMKTIGKTNFLYIIKLSELSNKNSAGTNIRIKTIPFFIVLNSKQLRK
jgi:hypothetical protein